MKVQIRDKEALDSLTVANLRAYLEAHGWGNERPWGTWAAILSKEGRGKMWEVAVPNEAGGLLYAESVAEIIATLAEAEDRSQLDVFYDLADGISDTVAQVRHGGVDSMTTQKFGRLEQVDLRQSWNDEAQNFTPWLAEEENLSLLSETLNIDQLELVAREQSVGRYRADILCRDTAGDSLVLIENQITDTNHTHLGQVLTYAAGLETVTIVWIAANFTDQHRAALDWLNDITDEKFRFFGLEVELWRIGDSLVAPKFNVVSRPNNWSKTTRRAATGEISETALQQQRFWEDLSKHLERRTSNIRLTAPPARPWTSYGIGRTGFQLWASLSPRAKQISVHLRLTGAESKAHFALLAEMKEAIEHDIGAALEWAEQPNDNVSRIILEHGTDPTDESQWEQLIEWISTTLEKFDHAFRERVRRLDATDWQPESEIQEE